MKRRNILPDVFVSVVYDNKRLTALYYTSNGKVLLRSGGPRNWRFNNPGNIDAVGSSELQNGRIGKALVKGVGRRDDHLAAIFESYEAGCKAQTSLLRRKYKDNTILEMTKIYAPTTDGNDPTEYANELLKTTGVSSTQKIGDMTDEEIEKIAHSMRVKEGYYSTHQPYEEKWIETTNITVSDGAKSIPGHAFEVTLGTETYKWTTDFFGKLPSIFHTERDAKIEIKSKSTSGKEEVVYKSTMGDRTKNILLKKNYSQFMATTLIDKPSPPRHRNTPKSVTYVVSSNDENLDVIAIRYNVSTSELAKDNSITESTKIYPGQTLVIIYDKTGNVVDSAEQLPWEIKGDSAAVPPIPSIKSIGGKTKGSALANLPHDQKNAPWMEIAVSEAIKYKGENESAIEKNINYHKEVNKKSLNSMTGTRNAWCASFVNYCLKAKGYAIWLSYTEAKGVKESPDFFKIQYPVWGCIAYITYPHVTFFYGFDSANKNNFIGLGGNQGDTIKFSNFPLSKATFYLPISYKGKIEVEMSKKIGTYSAKELNELINTGINTQDGRVR